MKANGAHYKVAPGEQHHQRVLRLGLNWYAGNITKYAERAPHKGTAEDDIIKILDYAQMWLDTYRLTPEQEAKLIEISLKIQKQAQSGKANNLAKSTDLPSAYDPQPKGYVDQDRSA